MKRLIRRLDSDEFKSTPPMRTAGLEQRTPHTLSTSRSRTFPGAPSPMSESKLGNKDDAGAWHDMRKFLTGTEGHTALLMDLVATFSEQIPMWVQGGKINAEVQVKLFEHVTRAQESLRIIDHCSGQQRALAEGVLKSKKDEDQKTKILNPRQAVMNVIDIFRPKATEKNIVLNALLPEEDFWLQGIQSNLERVLSNLVDNALEYIKQGEIIISFRQLSVVKSMVILQFIVRDTGPGVEKARQRELFQLFRQGNEGVKSKKGFGIGLSICKNLVAQMGGEIHIESEFGKGSQFIFTIQGKIVNQPNILKTSLSSFASPFSGVAESKEKSILIADDTDINSQLMKRMLEKAGYHCEIAINGKDACAMWKARPYDLIIMDIVMPMMNGLDAIKEIRQQQNGHDVPIIALSGNAEEKEQQRALAFGATAYVVKPPKMLIFIEMVKSLLVKTPIGTSESFETKIEAQPQFQTTTCSIPPKIRTPLVASHSLFKLKSLSMQELGKTAYPALVRSQTMACLQKNTQKVLPEQTPVSTSVLGWKA